MLEPGMLQLIGIGIQTILFLLAGYGMVIRTDNSVNSLKEEVKEMQREIKSMANVVIQIAVQTVRIDGINERMNMLDARLTKTEKHGD
jgi:hypothetical protein